VVTGRERLENIAVKLKAGETANPVTVRAFLSWFGAQRRSYWNVWTIRRGLEKAGLETIPDFESAYLDSNIEFALAQEGAEIVTLADSANSIEALDASSMPLQRGSSADPAYRISKLEAANRSPLFIAPDASVRQAVTVMMTNDYSQLPVMTSERDVKGIVSWNTIGARMVLKKDAVYVRDVMDQHQEIRADVSMFQAISAIGQHGYVLVRGIDNKITGIVTASDLNIQFQQLAEPFLLLGEIENHIRTILDGKFTLTELTEAGDPSDNARKIEAVSDLTFGEYLRLMENEHYWNKTGILLDRKTFCFQLDQVRKIRNDVTHFDPDGIPESDLKKLRGFSHFLQQLQTIKAY
jgi:CBS domain-containing protein